MPNLGQFGPLIGMLVVWGLIFYFLLIRPQKNKDKAFKNMLADMEVGDKIVTIGGFKGKITKIKDDEVIFSCGPLGSESSLTIAKQGISQVIKKEQ